MKVKQDQELFRRQQSWIMLSTGFPAYAARQASLARAAVASLGRGVPRGTPYLPMQVIHLRQEEA
jgi:hypothetical protein